MLDRPTNSIVPIKVSLSRYADISSSFGSPVIHISLKNSSPHKVSFLRWSSPPDPRAAAIGVFEFTSIGTNTVTPCLHLKLNRKLPESGYFSLDSDGIVTLPVGGTFEKDIDVKEPEVALTMGECYRAAARGH
ncbi:hypothetical protein G7Y89_g10451 [Cudoniella acicularis]|uniref:Uncharacterized protein n=1 Tax=Cudoniella acicularis TaxID=354080 RepID=A0A8H4VYR3_9HELO|nr:hypothetical protein G7Y89_g10451 [Cudoniella acicularis]